MSHDPDRDEQAESKPPHLHTHVEFGPRVEVTGGADFRLSTETRGPAHGSRHWLVHALRCPRPH
jgi:hypothetical protein